MEVGFPANGRTINARELEKILFDFVPECVKHALMYKNMDAGRLRSIVDLRRISSISGKCFPSWGFVLLWRMEACSKRVGVSSVL